MYELANLYTTLAQLLNNDFAQNLKFMYAKKLQHRKHLTHCYLNY